MLGLIAMVDGGYWTLLCNKMRSSSSVPADYVSAGHVLVPA
ncbi:hypothetical protein Tco_0293292, partial [Tanacetum coccineum]